MVGVMALVALFLSICTGALAVGAWEDREYSRMWLNLATCFLGVVTYTHFVA